MVLLKWAASRNCIARIGFLWLMVGRFRLLHRGAQNAHAETQNAASQNARITCLKKRSRPAPWHGSPHGDEVGSRRKTAPTVEGLAVFRLASGCHGLGATRMTLNPLAPAPDPKREARNRGNKFLQTRRSKGIRSLRRRGVAFTRLDRRGPIAGVLGQHQHAGRYIANVRPRKPFC